MEALPSNPLFETMKLRRGPVFSIYTTINTTINPTINTTINTTKYTCI